MSEAQTEEPFSFEKSVVHLETVLNHAFSDRGLLRTALTHASAGERENYERLEFLGDRVLGLAVADLLYETFPSETEGPLAKRLAALVQRSVLAGVAAEIGLSETLILSTAERAAGGSANENILADTVEALLGALYRDAGWAPCVSFIRHVWSDRVRADKAPPEDPKTTLQEWTQGRGLGLPVYTMESRSGPDHAPLFTIRLDVAGYPPVRGIGSARARAEKEAAAAFLLSVRNQKE